MIKRESPRMNIAGAMEKPKEGCWKKLPTVIIISG
jgi:hypothetical protein|nr:MAG TPA: hypothetical protein [Caudoviricetes sp.]